MAVSMPLIRSIGTLCSDLLERLVGVGQAAIVPLVSVEKNRANGFRAFARIADKSP